MTGEALFAGTTALVAATGTLLMGLGTFRSRRVSQRVLDQVTPTPHDPDDESTLADRLETLNDRQTLTSHNLSVVSRSLRRHLDNHDKEHIR